MINNPSTLGLKSGSGHLELYFKDMAQFRAWKPEITRAMKAGAQLLPHQRWMDGAVFYVHSPPTQYRLYGRRVTPIKPSLCKSKCCRPAHLPIPSL